MSFSSKLKGPDNYRMPVSHHHVPGSLPLAFHVTLILKPVVCRLWQYRRLTITVLLLINIGGNLVGSSAPAQTPQGPVSSFRSPPESRAAVATLKANSDCTQDQCRRPPQDLEHALFARLKLLYPDTSLGSDGPAFAIREEESWFQGNLATVSYVLVLFETSEEGSPYKASPHKEKWAHRAKEWQFVEDVSPSQSAIAVMKILHTQPSDK